MDKKEIANLLEIELRTLYNWEKSRQNLYLIFYSNNLWNVYDFTFNTR